MNQWCDDCGTKFSDGCCPNCHEELFIYNTQGEYLDYVGEDFLSKVKHQSKLVAEFIENG